MKTEKQVLWIVNLLKGNKFVRKLIGKSSGGCKTDFERLAGACENNKEFRMWLDELIEEGSLEFLELRKLNSFSKEVETYVINKSKMVKRLRNIPFYKSIKEVVIENETALGF